MQENSVDATNVDTAPSAVNGTKNNNNNNDDNEHASSGDGNPVEERDQQPIKEEVTDLLSGISAAGDPMMSQMQNSIRSHPLFPLLRVLLLKCEEATSSLNGTSLQSEDVKQVRIVSVQLHVSPNQSMNLVPGH